jgi:hypothetical protein
MARVTRSSVLLKIQDILGLQAGTEQVPVMANNSIQPVMNINPAFSTINKTASATATGNATIYTTPADKDFYLTGLFLGTTKDVSCDLVNPRITITVGGAAIAIMNIPQQTLTAGSDQIYVTFPYPLKIDRNTAIVLVGAFTVGTCTKYGSVNGFILE